LLSFRISFQVFPFFRAFFRTMDTTVSKFGLSPYEFAGILRCYHGYIMGGAVLSVWLERPLEDTQDLDVFVPLPVPLVPVDDTVAAGYYTIARLSDGVLTEADGRWNTWMFVEAIRRNFESFLTSRGYVAVAADGSHEYYGTRHFRNVIHSVRSYTRTIDGVVRKIQVVFTRDITAAENAARVDFDCCQFYAAPDPTYTDVHFLPISSIHDNAHDMEIHNGRARVLYDLDSLTTYERLKMDERIRKYTARGFFFRGTRGGTSTSVLPLPPRVDRSALITILSTDLDTRAVHKALLAHRFLFEYVPVQSIICTLMRLLDNPDFEDAPWVFTFKFVWWAEDRKLTFNLVKAEIPASA
jgi:predicted RNA binding protein YcfA (HicA-like mRNA interferase family)